MRLWPRGVDTRQFAPSRASAAVRRRWGIDDRRLVILCAGRLSSDRGLQLIAPIQQGLHRRGIAHRFVFAGEGPLLPQLQRDCPEGMFLGRVSMDRMAVAMASADVLLFPSAIESCGKVVLEAQASGLPVIVSDQGGPREQMVPEATGFVCRSGSAGDFVDALVQLGHRVARRAMGASARQFALGYDWSLALQPLFATWTQVVGSRTTAMRPHGSPEAGTPAGWPMLQPGPRALVT